MFTGLDLTVWKGDKIALIGPNDLAKTVFFQVLMGEHPASSGHFKWGLTTSRAYYPRDNAGYFDSDLSILDWMRQYSRDKTENYVRGFLGRMLFSGEEGLKPVNVLSGGERVRCMLARMMLSQPNVLILDEPTNHLDLESITSLNSGLERFRGTILFSSHDHQLVQTVANRIVEITPKGYIDQVDTTFDEYLSSEIIKEKRRRLYG
jgi:ATPase subunit of ABC transporter with duplicated ATPase domains